VNTTAAEARRLAVPAPRSAASQEDTAAALMRSTVLRVRASDTVREIRNRLRGCANGAGELVCLVDDAQRPLGIVTAQRC
jgi:Mg/Co/Ni transporter MgtE